MNNNGTTTCAGTPQRTKRAKRAIWMNSEGATERRPILRNPATRISIPARIENLAREVVGAVFEVHRALGPGLLENAYESCLATELEIRRLSCRRQLPLPIEYKGRFVDAAYRIDFLVEDALIVELKAVEELREVHKAQVISYLRLRNLPLGLLVNFNVPLVRDGIHRIINLRWQETPGSDFAPSLLRC